MNFLTNFATFQKKIYEKSHQGSIEFNCQKRFSLKYFLHNKVFICLFRTIQTTLMPKMKGSDSRSCVSISSSNIVITTKKRVPLHTPTHTHTHTNTAIKEIIRTKNIRAKICLPYFSGNFPESLNECHTRCHTRCHRCHRCHTLWHLLVLVIFKDIILIPSMKMLHQDLP
jgi:hypothetical protein